MKKTRQFVYVVMDEEERNGGINPSWVHCVCSSRAVAEETVKTIAKKTKANTAWVMEFELW